VGTPEGRASGAGRRRRAQEAGHRRRAQEAAKVELTDATPPPPQPAKVPASSLANQAPDHRHLRRDRIALEIEPQLRVVIGVWGEDEREIGYWIDRAAWGKGLATAALAALLAEVHERPLTAHVAEHNVGSMRVLERNGFVEISREQEEDVVMIGFRLDQVSVSSRRRLAGASGTSRGVGAGPRSALVRREDAHLPQHSGMSPERVSGVSRFARPAR
jgi:RimJ/RimL family protein N-acetyltransferase